MGIHQHQQPGEKRPVPGGEVAPNAAEEDLRLLQGYVENRLEAEQMASMERRIFSDPTLYEQYCTLVEELLQTGGVQVTITTPGLPADPAGDLTPAAPPRTPLAARPNFPMRPADVTPRMLEDYFYTRLDHDPEWVSEIERLLKEVPGVYEMYQQVVSIELHCPEW
ncbi:MAG: hypothetical protein JO250_06815 [Armatimonadetes bacterium]|nr:hypothetical protein [Armatimonadota bacterium]